MVSKPTEIYSSILPNSSCVDSATVSCRRASEPINLPEVKEHKGGLREVSGKPLLPHGSDWNCNSYFDSTTRSRTGSANWKWEGWSRILAALLLPIPHSSLPRSSTTHATWEVLTSTWVAACYLGASEIHLKTCFQKICTKLCPINNGSCICAWGSWVISFSSMQPLQMNIFTETVTVTLHEKAISHIQFPADYLETTQFTKPTIV